MDVSKHILMPESTDGTKPEHRIQALFRVGTRSKSSLLAWTISTWNLFYELTVKGWIETIAMWSRRGVVIYFKVTESSHTAHVLEIVQISWSASLLQCWMLELQLQKQKKLEASKLAEVVEHLGRPSKYEIYSAKHFIAELFYSLEFLCLGK